jgi:hypothetical protein
LRKRHFVLSLFLVAVLFSCSDDDRSLAWESYADLFAPPVNYAVGIGPDNVCAGDFDGDGYSDLAVLNYSSRSASILMNEGNASFRYDFGIDFGRYPVDICTADFNGDGKMDLALVLSEFLGIHIWLSIGDGQFAQGGYYPASPHTYSIVSCDFNGDGCHDIATGSMGITNVSVLLNNGNGAFSPAENYHYFNYHVCMPSSDSWLSSADLDGDFDLDLAMISSKVSSVRVLLNNGDETFAYGPSHYLSSKRYTVSLADIDGDRDNDLLTIDGVRDKIVILMNTGDGTFGKEKFYYPGIRPVSVSVADFNLDGHIDIAIANKGFSESSTASLAILINKGNGDFMHRLTYKAGSSPEFVCSADFDNDGDFDIAMSDYYDNTVSIYLNRTIE